MCPWSLALFISPKEARTLVLRMVGKGCSTHLFLKRSMLESHGGAVWGMEGILVFQQRGSITLLKSHHEFDLIRSNRSSPQGHVYRMYSMSVFPLKGTKISLKFLINYTTNIHSITIMLYLSFYSIIIIIIVTYFCFAG